MRATKKKSVTRCPKREKSDFKKAIDEKVKQQAQEEVRLPRRKSEKGRRSGEKKKKRT